ncbi:MAG: Ig-like domain-containing protein, partial [Lachnospiraceae bacterium]|nr:Ig-like domain-containing protein [Lachnospiraceae bacterium]
NKDSDNGIVYTKLKEDKETYYSCSVPERGWLIIFSSRYFTKDNLYKDNGIEVFKNASMTNKIAYISETHGNDAAQELRYVEAGTLYFKDRMSGERTVFMFFLPDSAVISHSLVKNKDNNGYTDTVAYTPHLGTTYLRTGIIAVTDINKGWGSAASDTEDVYSITENGEYTVKAVFTDTEWKDFPVMYSFSVYDIGKDTKTDKTKDDSKTKDAKLNVTSKTIKVGESFKLKMTGTKVVSFKSSKKSVAKVSSSGKVTGKKKGSATIKVTCENGETYTCKVKVEKK